MLRIPRIFLLLWYFVIEYLILDFYWACKFHVHFHYFLAFLYLSFGSGYHALRNT